MLRVIPVSLNALADTYRESNTNFLMARATGTNFARRAVLAVTLVQYNEASGMSRGYVIQNSLQQPVGYVANSTRQCLSKCLALGKYFDKGQCCCLANDSWRKAIYLNKGRYASADCMCPAGGVFGAADQAKLFKLRLHQGVLQALYVTICWAWVQWRAGIR